MDKRFLTFTSLAFLVFCLNVMIVTWFQKQQAGAPQNPPVQAAKDEKPKPVKADKEKPIAAEQPADVAEPVADAKPAADEQPAEAPVKPEWGTLGSFDPASPYRMLVTWTNQGAAVERIELNSPRYRALEDRKKDREGFLGEMAAADAPKKAGVLVNVVGPGTPVELAGLKVSDVITALDATKLAGTRDLQLALLDTRPDQEVVLTVLRDGKAQRLNATLVRRPLEMIRPERYLAEKEVENKDIDTQDLDFVKPGEHDPFSLLLTLKKFGNANVNEEDLEQLREPTDEAQKALRLEAELPGVELRRGYWEVEKVSDAEVRFVKRLPKLGLEIVKRFKLAKLQPDEVDDPDAKAYHLTVNIEIHNIGPRTRQVAYQFDGPTGLPTEGAWYGSKIGRKYFAAAGLRDVVARFEGGDGITEANCSEIAQDKAQTASWGRMPLDYAGVDAQYFAAALLPQKAKADEVWFDRVRSIRVGPLPDDKADLRLADVTFRLESKVEELAPGASLKHEYEFFAGPKQPELLASYGTFPATLRDLVYYGWPIFATAATLMTWILHKMYAIVGNYGLAIFMLTVLVRGCMFPLSRKQALGAQKMQQLQPEIKRIAEKYKNSEQRAKAQQELFRKHNYHPLAGCLPVLLQMPIFIGLYRGLSIDIQLRQAPLLGSAIRWCSNLAGPDMFLDWSRYMPDFVVKGTGFLGLGPYLNILPLATIGLFIWQQKMFMPPAADEQAAMQQKMMQVMMIFMGFMFFKVASGLCLYFIASSLWGIAERKLLPKTTGAKPALATAGVGGGSGSNGAAGGKKKQRERK